jgi:hypothetical protein
MCSQHLSSHQGNDCNVSGTEMSITYLLPLMTLKDNGGSAVAFAFARQLVANGGHVTILASNYHGTSAVNLAKNAGIDFYIVPSFGRNRLAALILFYIYGFIFSLSRRPVLIYTHIATGLIPSFASAQSCMLAQDIEYRFYTGARRSVAKLVFARLLPKCLLLVTSERLATYFRRKGYNIIYDDDIGISRAFVESQTIKTDQTKVSRNIDFLLIAKRGSHKRYDETVAVAKNLAAAGHSVTLIDQHPTPTTNGPLDKLLVLKPVTAAEMQALYQSARVFVSISKAEGYGLTPLEALAQGCQVVTTTTPSTMYLRHSALEKIHGGDSIISRVTAAVEQRIASAAHPEPEGGNSAFPGPFMEDWAIGACAALAEQGGRKRLVIPKG